ncbi:MAG: alanine--tRNA ligase-related protein [Candidatus Pacebacteria bacterium]|nr:alanine--tRNA ligase-related protein [Candidatus Paceibacterota bacterium]
MINTIQIKKMYLDFMVKRGWPIRQSEPLIHSTFPHCFVISGAVDWFNRKLKKEPFKNEGYAICQRVFRHFDEPDETHLPFFIMAITVSWNLYPREKVITDNFEFFQHLGLNLNKLKVSYWQGGKIFGKAVKLNADIEKLCQGKEWNKLVKEGMDIKADTEAVKIWKKCGIKNSQFVPCGEVGSLDPSGLDAILLNAREHFAGVRSELYYNNLELGPFLYEAFVKKTMAVRDKISQDIFENNLKGDNFLIKLKPNAVPGGFGLERLTMAVNNFNSVYELEPYCTMKNFLINQNVNDEKLIEQTVAYIPTILWLIYDGAHLLPRAEHQRRSIYRKVIKTIIKNLRKFELDADNIYLKLFEQSIAFYLQDEGFQELKGLEGVFLNEINLQKERMLMEIKEENKKQKQLDKRQKNNEI